MTAAELVGRFYPVKDAETNAVVGYKKIVVAREVENSSSFYIELHGRQNSGLVISLNSAINDTKAFN